jgi:hypothetical protein
MTLAGSAEDLRGPVITRIQPDWAAAAAEVRAFANDETPDAVSQLNAATGGVFPHVAASPVPVLLPFDTAAFLRDRGMPETSRPPSDYFSGFRLTQFFLAGPGGYDALLTAQRLDMPDLGLGFPLPIAVHLSGAALIYELHEPVGMVTTPVNGIGADFPDIKRVYLESYLRYAFTRNGVPYVVSIECGNGARKPSCRDADKVALRLLKSLQIVGGTPQTFPATVEPHTIDRPDAMSSVFTYHPAGDIIPGTGVRGNAGRADTTVYSRIRFPFADAPAFANSQAFNSFGTCDLTGRISAGMRGKVPAYRCRLSTSGQLLVQDEAAPENYSYPWRDNFCEHRWYAVGQCPGGSGHQGQDIRPASCKLKSEGATRCEAYQHAINAVRDGMVMRMPTQMAVYLVVNTADERIRFRYLHMLPRQLDADEVFSGRLMREGEVIGMTGNFDKGERATTYHLHFDIQVPTRYGWVFVNPYMTLVTAYERQIRGRGQEVTDPPPPEPALPMPATNEPVAEGTVVAPAPDTQNALQVGRHDRVEPAAVPDARYIHRPFPTRAAAPRRWERLGDRVRRASGKRTRHALLR